MFAAILASALSLLAPPRFSDPTLMSVYAASNTMDIATVFFGDDRATNFTMLAWVRWNPNGRDLPIARSTREGGPALADLQSHDYDTPLPLSAGTWAEECLPASYTIPDSLPAWRHGCYCLNVETDSDLTINVGGAETSIAAAPGVKQIRNILATSASRWVSVSAASAGATVKFGIAELPLCQFVGGQSDSHSSLDLHDESIGGIASNEWRMICFQGTVTNGFITTSMRMFNSLGVVDERDKCTSQRLLRPHTTFAEGARIRLMVASLFGIMGVTNAGADPHGYGDQPPDIFAVYALRVYRGWLPDALIDRMRLLDHNELARRGWL